MTEKRAMKIAPIIVRHAPEEKKSLLKEFEQTQNIRLPVNLKQALRSLNYKELGNILAFVSERITEARTNSNENRKGKEKMKNTIKIITRNEVKALDSQSIYGYIFSDGEFFLKSPTVLHEQMSSFDDFIYEHNLENLEYIILKDKNKVSGLSAFKVVGKLTDKQEQPHKAPIREEQKALKDIAQKSSDQETYDRLPTEDKLNVDMLNKLHEVQDHVLNSGQTIVSMNQVKTAISILESSLGVIDKAEG